MAEGEGRTMDNGWDSFLAGMNAGKNHNCCGDGFGYGMNGMWNNPFMYLIWLALFTRNGTGLFGGNGDGAGATTTIEALGEIKAALASGSVSRENLAQQIGNMAQSMGYNRDTIVAAIMNNGAQISNSINQIQMALCSDSKDTLMALSNIGNMVQSGTSTVVNAIQSCCCQTQQTINNGFANTNLNIERQGNQLANGLSQLGYATQSQFCDLKFQNAQDKNEIILAGRDNTNAILATMRQQEIQGLRDELSYYRMANLIRCGGNGPAYGSPYVNALYPNGSQSYPYYVKNTPQTTTA